jgi:hypothetical protein
LARRAVCFVVRERVAAAGYDPSGFSGHSLRSGFATSAAQAGVSSWRIAEIDRDGRAVAMKYDAEKQVWHFKIELLT